MNKTLIEKKALDFREVHGLGKRDSIYFRDLLQKLDVVTLFKPMSNLSGMALKVTKSNGRPFRFMLINSNQTIGRQHFTICHELYHLYVQENFQSMTCQTGMFDARKDPEEYRADLFAAYLLMPHDGIISQIPWDELEKDTITIETVLRLEQYYACSRLALVFRLQELGFLSKERAEEFKKTPKRDALQYGYDAGLYEKGNENRHLGNYGLLAKDLLDRDRISESHYYQLMEELGVKFDENE